MRPIPVAALALLCACAGYTHGEVLFSDAGGPPIGGGPSDAGSSDAGDAGSSDAGSSDAGDAGCAALTLNADVIDGCSSGLTGTASVNVTPSNSCSVTISGTTTYSSCNGRASGGTANAFTGTCGSYPCTSTSLPGNLTCTVPGGTSCTVSICDGGC